MTAAEFRDELVNLGTCFCPKEQVPYILNSGRHAPDCHADERWVEDFDAMLASVVADAEARGRQQALLSALWVLGESREYSIRFPARPTADEAQAFTVGVINTTVQTIHDAVLALAKEATRDE